MAELAVVIVTYNSAYVLEQALASVTRCLGPVPVIIVDNGSTDATLEIAQRRQVTRVVSGHGNVGYGAGVNLGISAAESTCVLIINPDIVIDRVDAAALTNLLSRCPVGLIGCVSSAPADSQPPIMALWSWRRELLWMLWTWFLKPRAVASRRPRPRRGALGWVSGAAFIVSRDEWHVVGGFDESLFLYYEDVDLSRRYNVSPYPVLATTAVNVSHARRESERGSELELVQSWVFRSLVETTHTWQGALAARQAALMILVGLRFVERAGRLSAVLPSLRLLALRKADGARTVRLHLQDHPPAGPKDHHYGAANAMFRDLRHQDHLVAACLTGAAGGLASRLRERMARTSYPPRL